MRCSRGVCGALIFLLTTFCTVPVMNRSFVTAPSSLDRKAQYLKAHLRNGDLYVLSQWSVDATEKHVTGTGDHYDPDRKVVEHGTVTVPIDSVALFETNVIAKSKRIASLSIMTGVTAAMAVICATNTKACFGSCPTFYTSDGDQWSLQAEGFSASIAPALEKSDLDSLYRVHPTSRHLTLRMTNEALETHVVRNVTLLAAPRERGARVFATADREFWSASHVVSPTRCHAAEGDCGQVLTAFDGVERFSKTDGRDLSRHEIIDLQFDPPSDDAPYGIVIAARQTMLTTFLFYQTLAYLGSRTTAALATNGIASRANGVDQLLGGIDILVDDSGRWRKVATSNETGPLAADVHLLRLPRGAAKNGRIRLSLARGLWRLDYVALARLDHQVEPIRLFPVEVRHADNVVRMTADPITTMPGDVYEYAFELPGAPEDHEMFLDSRGYYLEWMRDEWIREESLLGAAMIFRAPRLAVRVLAPRFKAIEPEIESQFWKSRYVAH